MESRRINQKGKLKYNMSRLRLQYRCQLDDLVDEIGFAPINKEVTEQLAHIHASNKSSYE
jgi:hypothetical protein